MNVTVQRRLLRIAVSCGVIAAIVALCASIPYVRVATVVLVLLLAILAIANRSSFLEAAAATGLGALLLDYFFLPPRGWGIEGLQHWLIVLTFLAVALATSYQVARAKSVAEEAAVRHRGLEELYAFGQDFPMEGDPTSLVAKSLDSLVRVFQIEAVAFYDSDAGTVTCSGPREALFRLNCFGSSPSKRSFHR